MSPGGRVTHGPSLLWSEKLPRTQNFSAKIRKFVCVCSVMSSQVTLCDPMSCTPQSPLSMGFSRQEYWSRVPFPTPEDLPEPRIEPMSLASPALAGGFFTILPPGKLKIRKDLGKFGLLVTLPGRQNCLCLKSTILDKSEIFLTQVKVAIFFYRKWWGGVIGRNKPFVGKEM